MSVIYDSIRSACATKSSAANADQMGPIDWPKATSSGVELEIDLAVYGRGDEGPFYEKVRATAGNATGGVLLLSFPVATGQSLLLINNGTSDEQICAVTRVFIRDALTSEVFVTFAAPNPYFWQARRGKYGR